MNHSRADRLCRTQSAHLLRLGRWMSHRRRAATGLLLRGACYGAGTAAVSLLSFWIQHRR